MPGLRTAVDLPAPEDVECLTIHDEHARRSVRAILAAASDCTDVNTFRAAVYRVEPRVSRLSEYLLRLNDLVNARLGRIGLGIHDVDARGTKPGDDEIAPLDKGVSSERRQSGRAC